MKNKQLADDLQQALTSLCSASASINILSSLAQKIEIRFKELEELEEKVDSKTKNIEEREKRLKENEEKMNERDEKQRKWEEIEKQMEINSQKVQQVVKLNVGMSSSSSSS